MRILAAGLIFVLSAPALAQEIAAPLKAPVTAPAKLAGAAIRPHRRGAVLSRSRPVSAPGGFAIDGWYTLAPAAGAGLIRSFDSTPAGEDRDNITVYGRRGRDLEADWRAELRASAPQYEARSSAAAQPLYGGQAVWSSPEQEHVMSGAKDSLGLCGALGGLITCPDK
jgi:hypothetical protein